MNMNILELNGLEGKPIFVNADQILYWTYSSDGESTYLVLRDDHTLFVKETPEEIAKVMA